MKDNWEKVKLGDLIKFYNGEAYKILNQTGDFPVFGSGGLMGFTDDFMYDGEAILLPRKGTLTNIQYLKSKFWVVDTTYYAVVDKSKADTKFLWNYLQVISKHLMNLDSGSAVPSMTQQAYNEIPVILPDLPTQRRIAAVLSCLDEKIALNNRINDNLEAMAKTVYEYWFVQNTDEKWERKTVKDLLVQYSDTSIHIDAKSILQDGKYPVITQDTGDLIKGYTNEKNPILDFPVLIFGDHSCTLRYIDFPFFRGADGTQLLHFGELYLTQYMFFSLNQTIPFLPNFGKYERHFKYLKDLEITIPPTTLLLDFHKVITPLFDTIAKNREENLHLTRLRDFLLPLLMNGQVSIKN